jgi:hypothetical protein
MRLLVLSGPRQSHLRAVLSTHVGSSPAPLVRPTQPLSGVTTHISGRSSELYERPYIGIAEYGHTVSMVTFGIPEKGKGS